MKLEFPIGIPVMPTVAALSLMRDGSSPQLAVLLGKWKFK
jgi:hypothetical protein